MPAQKRSSSENNINGGGGSFGGNEEESHHQHYRRKQSRREQQQQQQQRQQAQHQQQLQQKLNEEEEEEEQEADTKEEEEEVEDDDEDDSDGSVTDPEEITEYITVKLSDIRKDVQCPICLGIIKKTRTVMECMHRFCRECIDKSMRMGNNECPACRTHCASRRSLRDDPRYDALIETLYPDIEKYEEEELTFHEEERNRNKQIQASIAEISRRQSEALVKRRVGRDSGAASTSRIPRSYRNAYTRRRRNSRSTEIEGSDDNEDEIDNDENKDYSSDELGTEVKQRRRRRRTGGRPSQRSPSAANSDGGCIENETENRTSPGPVRNRELAWGRGGARSHTRHGIANGRGARTRLSKLVDYLHSLKENDNELDVHLMLVPTSKQKTPSLQQPYLSCRPSLTVKHLCEHVANETSLQSEEVQMALLKETHVMEGEQSAIDNVVSVYEPNSLSQVLDGQDTLAGLADSCNSNEDHLILSYEQKEAI